MKKLIHKVKRYFSSQKIKVSHPVSYPAAVEQAFPSNSPLYGKTSVEGLTKRLNKLLDDFDLSPDPASELVDFKGGNPFIDELSVAVLLNRQGWVPTVRGFMKVGSIIVVGSIEQAFIVECRLLHICPVKTAIRLQHYFNDPVHKVLVRNYLLQGNTWQGLFLNKLVLHS